jgi:hypothetical protein
MGFNDFIIQSTFDKIFGLIENNSTNGMKSLSLISENLLGLCNNFYSSFAMKYILHMSILLDPACSSVKNSTNTSLCAYTKDWYIKKPQSSNRWLIECFEGLFELVFHKEEQKVPVISVIVPFPQICKYQNNDDSIWNEILRQPRSILFCNIDNNNFYKWWNFAAIIDYKWKNFGKTYYYSIWLFYTIYYICFTLATFEISELLSKILYILSSLLGFIHLSFEVRECLWRPNTYFKDLWNLFGK